MIKAVDLRKGKTILYENDLWVVHECQHVAKGNKRSYMQAKLKNLKDSRMTDVRYSVDDRIEVPFVESKEYDYLYKEGEKYIVMDILNEILSRVVDRASGVPFSLLGCDRL